MASTANVSMQDQQRRLDATLKPEVGRAVQSLLREMPSDPVRFVASHIEQEVPAVRRALDSEAQCVIGDVEFPIRRCVPLGPGSKAFAHPTLPVFAATEVSRKELQRLVTQAVAATPEISTPGSEAVDVVVVKVVVLAPLDREVFAVGGVPHFSEFSRALASRHETHKSSQSSGTSFATAAEFSAAVVGAVAAHGAKAESLLSMVQHATVQGASLDIMVQYLPDRLAVEPVLLNDVFRHLADFYGPVVVVGFGQLDTLLFRALVTSSCSAVAPIHESASLRARVRTQFEAEAAEVARLSVPIPQRQYVCAAAELAAMQRRREERDRQRETRIKQTKQSRLKLEALVAKEQERLVACERGEDTEGAVTSEVAQAIEQARGRITELASVESLSEASHSARQLRRGTEDAAIANVITAQREWAALVLQRRARGLIDRRRVSTLQRDPHAVDKPVRTSRLQERHSQLGTYRERLALERLCAVFPETLSVQPELVLAPPRRYKRWKPSRTVTFHLDGTETEAEEWATQEVVVPSRHPTTRPRRFNPSQRLDGLLAGCDCGLDKFVHGLSTMFPHCSPLQRRREAAVSLKITLLLGVVFCEMSNRGTLPSHHSFNDFVTQVLPDLAAEAVFPALFESVGSAPQALPLLDGPLRLTNDPCSPDAWLDPQSPEVPLDVPVVRLGPKQRIFIASDGLDMSLVRDGLLHMETQGFRSVVWVVPTPAAIVVVHQRPLFAALRCDERPKSSLEPHIASTERVITHTEPNRAGRRSSTGVTIPRRMSARRERAGSVTASGVATPRRSDSASDVGRTEAPARLSPSPQECGLRTQHVPWMSLDWNAVERRVADEVIRRIEAHDGTLTVVQRKTDCDVSNKSASNILTSSVRSPERGVGGSIVIDAVAVDESPQSPAAAAVAAVALKRASLANVLQETQSASQCVASVVLEPLLSCATAKSGPTLRSLKPPDVEERCIRVTSQRRRDGPLPPTGPVGRSGNDVAVSVDPPSKGASPNYGIRSSPRASAASRSASRLSTVTGPRASRRASNMLLGDGGGAASPNVAVLPEQDQVSNVVTSFESAMMTALADVDNCAVRVHRCPVPPFGCDFAMNTFVETLRTELSKSTPDTPSCITIAVGCQDDLYLAAIAAIASHTMDLSDNSGSDSDQDRGTGRASDAASIATGLSTVQRGLFPEASQQPSRVMSFAADPELSDSDETASRSDSSDPTAVVRRFCEEHSSLGLNRAVGCVETVLVHTRLVSSLKGAVERSMQQAESHRGTIECREYVRSAVIHLERYAQLVAAAGYFLWCRSHPTATMSFLSYREAELGDLWSSFIRTLDPWVSTTCSPDPLHVPKYTEGKGRYWKPYFASPGER